MDYEKFIGDIGEDKSKGLFSREIALLEGLTDRFSLHDFFDEFDESSLVGIQGIRDQIKEIFRLADQENEVDDSVHWLEPKLSKKFGDRKLLQVAGAIYSTKVLDHHGDATVYDICGGSGVLSMSIALLRPKGTTKVVCVDRKAHGLHQSETFRSMIENARINFEFRLINVADFEPEDQAAGVFYLAIHACGSATDMALLNSCGNTLVIPCCYGKTEKNPINEVNDDVWGKLCKMADWGSSGENGKRSLGRLAMRVVDSLRARNQHSCNARVRELTPTKVDTKDHGILSSTPG